MRRISTIAALTAAIALGGCASIGPASVGGGECRIFHDPGFAVRGRHLRDDQWIGRTQETGIGVCGWRRPAAVALYRTDFVVVPKKRHWYNRWRRTPTS